jgi:hypothetical protein
VLWNPTNLAPFPVSNFQHPAEPKHTRGRGFFCL